jgi:hypothetical protein
MLDDPEPEIIEAGGAGPEVVTRYGVRRPFAPLYNGQWRWACVVAHRRCGKTVAAVQKLVKAAVAAEKRPHAPPRFSYIAPTYAMARDIAWPYLVAYVKDIVGMDIRVSELSVTFAHNGARIRMYGSDNYDNLRGGYNDGVVIDETGDQDPRAWPEVIRPTLSDYKGWALFIGTPKGDNAFKDIATMAKANEDGQWMYISLPASKTGYLSIEELGDARRQMTASQYAQEYECSFAAGVMGAYYAADIEGIEKLGQVNVSVPYDRSADVYCSWDLGIGDATALWVFQIVGKEIHWLQVYENSGVDLGHYVDWVKALPFKVTEHILPHDAEARELQTGNSRAEFLAQRGLMCRVLPPHKIEDGIEAVRVRFPSMWFDTKTALGIRALRNYRAQYDERRKALQPRPRHDWTSHIADALRYAVMSIDGYRVEVDTYSDYETEWVL